MKRSDFIEVAIDTAEKEGILHFEKLIFKLRKSDAAALKLIKHVANNFGSAKVGCFLDALYITLCRELKSDCKKSLAEEVAEEILQYLHSSEVDNTIDTIRDTLIWLAILNGEVKRVTFVPSLNSYSKTMKEDK